jgi:hypothetical protein
MMQKWLEYLDAAPASWLALVVGLLVIACQLVAVGAVAGEQVAKGQQRELERKDQRLAQWRCQATRNQPAHHACPKKGEKIETIEKSVYAVYR